MKTFPWKEFLHTHPMFSTLRDDKRIDALLADDASFEKSYDKDQVIFDERDIGSSVFLIGAGTAEATLKMSNGQPVSLSVMRKGDLFGEMALIDSQERSATVSAKEPCTLLEIPGPEFERLMHEYPEIESRLLVMISRRLRRTGEQVLGLNIMNVDEKLKLFNQKLDTGEKLIEASARSAQTMFDQTKLRADEVINSAERSRDRLNKLVGIVSALATVILLILGAFGFKQVWDVHEWANDAKANAKESAADMDQVRQDSAAAKNLLSDVYKVRGAAIDIVRGTFGDKVGNGNMTEAVQDYRTLISIGGKGELNTAVDVLEPSLLIGEASQNTFTVALLDELAKDSERLLGDSKEATDESMRVKIYRLQIGYSILTRQDRSTRENLYTALAKYLESHPTARLQPSLTLSTVVERVQPKDPGMAAELKALRDQTTTQR